MVSITYLAHKVSDEQVQTVAEHSISTAEKCRDFGQEPWKELLYTMGMLHDVGKYQTDFQRRIRGESVQAPHAVCGAQACKSAFGSAGAAMILQYAIAGHHAGLPDSGTKMDTPDKPTLYGTLRRTPQDYAAWQSELSPSRPDIAALNAYLTSECKSDAELAERFAFFTRYCFSCLVDADWLDTERFCTGISRQTLPADFSGCLRRVNDALGAFRCETPLQKARAQLQKQAFDQVESGAQVSFMNMPTGSGKTLCSVKYALERAIRGKKQRIIYIIPYKSIIEQTADTFQKLFGEDARILRHQSTFSFESRPGAGEDDPLLLKQAAENWDAQIILTTAVQFFESVYSNKRSKLRKLHNMADSILIFDEAHLMPQDYLQPCLRAISYLTKYLNSEAVFLTATMPDYESLLERYGAENLNMRELIPDRTLFSAFRKCGFESLGEVSDEALLVHAQAAPSALIVVNKRSTACALYRMRGQGKRYHLSTYMTAFDRSRVIREIQQELAGLEKDYPNLENVPPERRVLVISTSLIEAGVDLDFFTVYRQIWGLDSILQTAGRCNREGRRPTATAYLFDREAERGAKQTAAQSVTRGILSEFEDISCAESIAAYYQRLFLVRREDLVRHSLGQDCPKPTQIPFRSYADTFELIDSQTVSVAVARNEESEKLLEQLRLTGQCSVRALQPYTFTVYQYELNQLMQQGVINDYGSGLFCLTSPQYYLPDLGVVLEGTDYIL